MNSYGVRPLRVFEPPGEVVGVDEVLQVGSQLVVGLVEVGLRPRQRWRWPRNGFVRKIVHAGV